MNKTVFEFLCRIKEDTYKLVTDQFVYWAWFTAVMARSESWLLFHGGAILILGRIFLLCMDIFKRNRDFDKPEWISNIKPLLKKEMWRNRRNTFLQNVWIQIKQFLKL